MSNSLAGKIALITGGSRGIGLAIADALLQEGTHVTVAARNGVRLREVVRQMRARRAPEPARIHRAEADVGRISDVRAMMHSMKGRGGLDILVNCAGVAGFSTVEEQSPEVWNQVVATNLTGAFHCAHEAIPLLRAGGGGWIINIGSLAVRNRFPGRAAYCASKAGLQAFSEVLMQELRYDDIVVCCISPGPVETAFAKRPPAGGHRWRLEPGDIAHATIQLLRCDKRVLPSLLELRPRIPGAFVQYPLS